MIQDIAPRVLHNEFAVRMPREKDICFVFSGRRILLTEEGALPTYQAVAEGTVNATYLFRIDERLFFLASAVTEVFPGFIFTEIHQWRKFLSSKEDALAALTAFHLYQWYRDNRFCGRCGEKTAPDTKERMLRCINCGNMIFPKIAPAIIVGVTDGDRILMSKYNGRAYKGYALLAGFTEIGETLEETVKREVQEEVGLQVKNIRYYKSQPWGLDSNVLMGFFADLDGEDCISFDHEELSMAQWYRREEIQFEPDEFSLTGAMIGAFMQGKV